MALTFPFVYPLCLLISGHLRFGSHCIETVKPVSVIPATGSRRKHVYPL